jgi:hypothetical protein
VGIFRPEYRFLEGIIFDSAIVIGRKFQKFIGIVIGDKISRIIVRKIADNNIFIDSQPWSELPPFID